MTIILTREEAQQVLGYLEEIHPGNMTPMAEINWSKAIETLRTRLAHPEPEPVAWRFDQAKYRENDLRGRQWAFNLF
jgi:hypothetical protein